MSIKTNAEIIRDETVAGANTAVRVGGNLVEIADDLVAKQSLINANTAKTSYTDSAAVALNTAKVGITPTQAANIVTNNAKISYTDATAVGLNTSKVSFDSTSSTRLANTSGTNTGDQVIPVTGVDFDPVGTDNSDNNAVNTLYSGLATSKQDALTLTTTGTSGASTLVGATLNIPQYAGGGTGDDVSTFAEKTGALVGTDKLVGLSGATDFNETISGIPLSIFNNDSSFTSNTGDALVANPLSQFAATTKAQLDGVISDGNVMYIGDAPTTHTHVASEVTDFDTEVSNNTSVAVNTSKISFDSTSSTRLANTSGTNTGDQAPITSTSTIIDLSNVIGNYDYMTTASTATTFTLTGAVTGGKALVLWDSTGSTDFPTVTGSTLTNSAAWEVNVEFYLNVENNGFQTEHYFTKKDIGATLVDLTSEVTGTLPVANGGTGLTSLSTLLNSNVTPTTLGLVIGTDVQAHSTVLDNTTASFLTAQETKLGHISVTQAVDLDTMESNITTNNAKVSATTANVKAINDRVSEDLAVTGTKNIDWSIAETFRFTMTGATVFSDTNLPSTGTGKVITIHMDGAFAPTYPAGWTTYIRGAYDTAALNTIVIEYVNTTTDIWLVQISQKD
jgi:hypothetical protein